jgi:hypothetical protein
VGDTKRKKRSRKKILKILVAATILYPVALLVFYYVGSRWSVYTLSNMLALVLTLSSLEPSQTTALSLYYTFWAIYQPNIVYIVFIALLCYFFIEVKLVLPLILGSAFDEEREQTTTAIFTSRKSKCFYCDSMIPENTEYCPRCGRVRVKCSVCNMEIFPEDRPVKCPYCGALSHRDHLAQWIREKGSCPKCGGKLKEITIGAAPKSNCLYCGTEIPENAEYCPHCGEARARCSICNKDIISGYPYVK